MFAPPSGTILFGLKNYSVDQWLSEQVFFGKLFYTANSEEFQGEPILAKMVTSLLQSTKNDIR